LTGEELKQSLNLVLTNYGRDADENIAALWSLRFIGFDAAPFREACLRIVAQSKFFPNTSEIIDAYQQVRRDAERARNERDVAGQRLLADGQGDCWLCGNTGVCIHTVYKTMPPRRGVEANAAGAGPELIGYDFATRCICPHGRDLRRYTRSQIDRLHIPEIQAKMRDSDKAAIKRHENPFYQPDIREVLKDDFTVYEARKKAERLSRRPMGDDEKLRVLRGMEAVGGRAPVGVAEA